MSKGTESVPDNATDPPTEPPANPPAGPPADPPADAAPPPPDRPLWRELASARWGDGAAAPLGWVVLGLTVGLGVFQLYTFMFLTIDSYRQRVLHLMFILVLVFLVRPAANRAWARSVPMTVLDLLLVGAAVVASVYPVYFYDEIVERTGIYTDLDVAMAALTVLLILEACRRVIGLFMALLVSAFLVYAWLGPLLPGALAHKGHTYQRIATYSYFSLDGVYGLPLGVAATFVFMFIFFGALLERSGGGAFFIDLAYSVTGRYRGGPAKGAVVASAFMGSVSGSAIANTVSTGAFTIPMMKKVGYKPHDAGGVEAAASTGGQLLPPIMGAGAFIMAELLQVPYSEVLKVAIIPALMYFAVVFLFVDILARKQGPSGMSAADIPKFGATLVKGVQFLLPLALLIYLLFQTTPLRAGLYATGLLFVVAMLRKASRLGWRDIAEVFVLSARNMLMVSVACAAAGIVVGMVSLTGAGLGFSRMMLSLGAGNLLLTLIMIAIASLVLGLGLPVTASYIVLAVLAVPALEGFGLLPIVAHMIIYWYSQDSNVTPPVALAAFAAAGIAGTSPMRTGVSAWKFAKGLYLIPLLMAYTPLLLNGSTTQIVLAVITGSVGLFAFAVALEGFWLRRTSIVERLAMTAAVPLLLTPSYLLDVLGAVCVVGVVVAQLWRNRNRNRNSTTTAAAVPVA